MAWFKKDDQKKSLDDLINSYGGNSQVEELENKLLNDLTLIYSNRASIEALKNSQAKSKIDLFSDQLILSLLSDEEVLNIIRANSENNSNVWRSIANAFKTKKKK